MASQEMTQKSLHEWFDYDGKTLSWKDTSRETKICKNNWGYPMIRFAGGARLVHRLVYLMAHGHVPAQLDHANCNKEDYSINNLRPTTPAQNRANTGAEKQNLSGYKGVCYDKRHKRWEVRVAMNNKTYRKVGFKDAKDADEFACLLRDMVHGEFANHKGVASWQAA
jgi:hypothetical protein